MKIRNTFIIFIVSGFWHGANWTFIIWGFLNAVYFLPYLLTNRNRNNLHTVALGRVLPNLRELLSMLLTFILTVFAWIFFRANDIGHAVGYINEVLSPSFLDKPSILPISLLIILGGFILVEWNGRDKKFAIEKLFVGRPKYMRFASYYVIILIIYLFGNFSSNLEFIYFQF